MSLLRAHLHVERSAVAGAEIGAETSCRPPRSQCRERTQRRVKLVRENMSAKTPLVALVRDKLVSFGHQDDEVLPEYIAVMVGNGKTQPEVAKELEAFMGTDGAGSFSAWLFAQVSSQAQAAPLPLVPSFDRDRETLHNRQGGMSGREREELQADLGRAVEEARHPVNALAVAAAEKLQEEQAKQIIATASATQIEVNEQLLAWQHWRWMHSWRHSPSHS